MHLKREHKQLALMIGVYVLFFFWLAHRRFMVFGWDTGDFGNFHDMFWWTFRGKPFYFASRGYSNFGLHTAFLWVQLLPIFWLFPSVTTLILMQSLFLGLAGVPMYLIARKIFEDHKAAILLALAFLLFPSIASQNVCQIEEPSFIAVYLLFAFYFFMQQRFGLFMLFATISCLGRENVPLAIAMFGVYAALLRRPWKWIVCPLALSVPYFLLAIFVLMPWFRGGHEWHAMGMFTYLGHTPHEIVGNTIMHPGLLIGHLFDEENVRYAVLLVQPLAWLLPFLSPASLMALPDLAINLVADNNALKVIAWHYNVITGTFLFLGAITGLKKLAAWCARRFGGGGYGITLASCLLLLVLAHWYIWFVPSQYRKLPYHDSLVRALQTVPPDKSVLVPASLQGHVCGREHWYTLNAFKHKPEFAAQFEYVILDANERRFPPVVTQEFFDALYKNPKYQLIFAENNVFVFRRLGGESDWKVVPPS